MLKKIGFSLLSIISVSAQTSQPLLPFQGHVADSSGRPIPDGSRLIQFQIHNDPFANSPTWGELHRTSVNGGLINVILGTKNPFPRDRADQPDKSFFDQPIYLQITPDANADNQITAADPPLLPRQTILPVIFVQEAGDSRKLLGQDWSSMLGINSPSGKIDGSRLVNITSNSIAPGTVDGSRVAPFSISSNHLAPGSITITNLAPLQIGTNVDVGGIAVSLSSGYQDLASTGDFREVTNLRATLRTTGRPVEIFLVGDENQGSVNGLESEIYLRQINANARSDAFISIFREGTEIKRYWLGMTVPPSGVGFPPSCIRFIDYPEAGRYTYSIKIQTVSANSGIAFLNVKLIAREW